jgi:hypothetical protein
LLLNRIVELNDLDFFLKILYQMKHLQAEGYYLEAAKTLFEETFKIIT